MSEESGGSAMRVRITEKGLRVAALMKDEALFNEAKRNVGVGAELPTFIAELERLKAERDKEVAL